MSKWERTNKIWRLQHEMTVSKDIYSHLLNGLLISRYFWIERGRERNTKARSDVKRVGERATDWPFSFHFACNKCVFLSKRIRRWTGFEQIETIPCSSHSPCLKLMGYDLYSHLVQAINEWLSSCHKFYIISLLFVLGWIVEMQLKLSTFMLVWI